MQLALKAGRRSIHRNGGFVMIDEGIRKSSKGRLRASIMRNSRTNSVDLFTDFTDMRKDLRVFSERVDSMSDILVHWTSPSPCPSCNQSNLRRSEGWSFKEWFLKFTGRRVLRCDHCGWESAVKLYRWEWETIITAAVVFFILLGYSLHWILLRK
jgi:hypothetical protein